MYQDKDLVHLGRTGLRVTPIGLGLAALGRPGYINLGHADDLSRDYRLSAMEAHSHEMLDLAWELGVRYYDVARSYGRAEMFLGAWLKARKIAPGSVTVGSKWGYTYTADWQVEAHEHEVKDHSLPVLRRQSRESRTILGEHLDLYQIHSATLDSGVLQNTVVLGELARMRDEGVVIGLSLSGPRQPETLRKAMSIRVDGQPLFGAVQATWNLLEPSAGAALQEAHDAGLGVIVKEVLANGRLTNRNDDPAFWAKHQQLEESAGGLGVGIDALALAAVLAQPWADVALSGAANADHLRSNLAAAELEWDEEMGDRLRPLVEPPEDYWATRAKLAWN
ncbi:MAG: aldo/keto reductase [Chloroflexota bacterium]|nr:MAG: aldo/keto reductase [Chloroflexota bacterium]